MKTSKIRKQIRSGNYVDVPTIMLKDIWREERKKEELNARKARAAKSQKTSAGEKTNKNK